ncbi:MAG: hypothetical protein JW709_09940 [Sedimentisphaerales bacterium]|nr:hypothetical protein [Sedimentisphaerales bacterium]
MSEKQPILPSVVGEVAEPGWADKVEAALLQDSAKPVDRWRNIRTLIVTLILFIAVMGGRFTFVDGLIVIGVLLVHEGGHYLGMKLFGYRDVKMFFIPFMGAAVAGQARTPKGWQQVIVSLLGPTPGLLIGIVLGIIALKTEQPNLMKVARLAMFINAFNLLPFVPLDGGRILETVLFSRHPAVEAGFKLFAVACLGLIAYLLGSIVLGVLAGLQLITIPIVLLHGKAVRKLRKTFVPDPALMDIQLPPRPYLQVIVDVLAEKLAKGTRPVTAMANGVKSVWRIFRQKPPGLVASVLFLAVYFTVLLLAVVAPLLFEVSYRISHDNRSFISQRILDDGCIVEIETYHEDDASFHETQIDADGWYHGFAKGYDAEGKVQYEGNWQDGYWHGEWRYYDTDGALTTIMDFDHGCLVQYRILENGIWRDIPPEEWESYTSTQAQTKPDGANSRLVVKRILKKLYLSSE